MPAWVGPIIKSTVLSQMKDVKRFIKWKQVAHAEGILSSYFKTLRAMMVCRLKNYLSKKTCHHRLQKIDRWIHRIYLVG